MAEMEDLDSFDRKILAEMEIDARQTGADLSEKIGLSPAACLRRLQRLRRIGAIAREVAIINPIYKRKGTQVFVLVRFDPLKLKQIDALMAQFSKHPDVERVWSVTGEEDVVLLMKCESMETFSDFADAYLFQPPVDGFQSHVVLKEVATESADQSA
ncbi:MAG: Lrp/AsnC family transcriptional regulator [Pseudomonadota bacterium]